MQQAVLPFLLYIVMQAAVMTVGLNIVKKKELRLSDLLESWIFGRMLLYAVLQILAVPMILLRVQFNVLFWSFTGICIVFFGFGLRSLKGRKWNLRINWKSISVLSAVMLVVIGELILWQAATYFAEVHYDLDDARWLAEANDALEYGDMMTRFYDTGEYIGQFVVMKDVTSPWPMMYSVAGRMLFTRPSVFAHTLYPPIAILMVYGCYWLIGKELLQKTEARLGFLLACVVIHLLMGGTPYTQAAFSLVRIWQGKASVAGIMIPLLLYLFICINKRNQTGDWMKVFLTACSGCLMSGMGISISAIMIGVYGGYHILAYRNWKRIPWVILCVLPSVVCVLIYTRFTSLF